MEHLLNKFQLLQFIIIILFTLLSYSLKSEPKINKDSVYYHFLLKMINYNKITNKIIKKNDDIISFKEEYKLLLKENNYFYIFYNHYAYVYFFKEKVSDTHKIYFNGINNINDMKLILKIILKIIHNDIDILLNKKGYFYKFHGDCIEKIYQKRDIYEVFHFLCNNVYNVQTMQKINLEINGFSIGGPQSQFFTLNILENFNDQFHITMYNVESWFGGNKDMYEEINKKVKLMNIYNNKSVFYFYNIFFQKYVKKDYIMSNHSMLKEFEHFLKYNNKFFPEGIFDYIMDYHVLSKFVK